MTLIEYLNLSHLVVLPRLARSAVHPDTSCGHNKPSAPAASQAGVPVTRSRGAVTRVDRPRPMAVRCEASPGRATRVRGLLRQGRAHIESVNTWRSVMTETLTSGIPRTVRHALACDLPQASSQIGGRGRVGQRSFDCRF